ncbi:MAG: hypothetical protein ACR2IF_06255 [Terriglobales bacterium]
MFRAEHFAYTVAWAIGIMGSTVPAYWLLVHPRIEYWRARRARLFTVGPLLFALWVVAGAITWPWRRLALYRTPWTWFAGALLVASGLWVYTRARRRFTTDQLLGRAELEPERHPQLLITEGIRRYVRHAFYLGHLLELIGWTIASGLLVLYALSAFAILTGAMMIVAEERELGARFGQAYRDYQQRVPAIVPRLSGRTVAIAAVLLVALALRAGITAAYPTVDWPDEIFQTTEPAHRLAFGYGVISWEWREGTRNWVLPAVLAAVMRLTAWMGAGSSGYLAAITFALSTLSLAVVWCAFRWGERLLGYQAGLIAALTCALWYDLIYYGPKALNEVVAGHLLVIALWLGQAPTPSAEKGGGQGWAAQGRGRWWSTGLLTGALLGATVGVRIQLAPAVLVAMIMLCRRQWRQRWAPMLAGAAIAFLAFGMEDALTWSYPFASYVRSVKVNLLQDKSASYGVAPWDWYFGSLLLSTSVLLPLILVGMRRAPLLAAVAATILITHSALAHKEYRFILPAVMLILVLAGLGLAEVLAWLTARMRLPSGTAIALAIVFVALTSWWTWGNSHVRGRYRGALPAFAAVGLEPEVCGVGVRGFWFNSGGYTWLHRPVPITAAAGERQVEALAPTFNVLVTVDGLDNQPAGFAREQCWAKWCVYRRPGGCVPDPAHEINAYLERTGQ